MNGSNKLELNEATMIEIIQEWWDSRTKDLRKQFVKGIRQDMSTNSFTVRLESEGE